MDKVVYDLGFDSVTSYVWVHHAGLPDLQTEYNQVRDQYFDYWSKAATAYGVPYIPNVTMGWDPSPAPTNRNRSTPPATRSPTRSKQHS